MVVIIYEECMYACMDAGPALDTGTVHDPNNFASMLSSRTYLKGISLVYTSRVDCISKFDSFH